MKNVHFNVEKFFHEAMNDEIVYSENMEKEQFELYLDSLFIKLAKLKSNEAKKQIEIIERMKRSLRRFQYVIINHSVQAKLIKELTLQNQILELKNNDLEKENNNLKENIK